MNQNGGSADDSFAAFCVCATPELLSNVIAAARELSRIFFAGEFRDYISQEKRPQFSQAIKEARACLAFVDFDRDPELALGTAERLNQIFQSRISVVAVNLPMDAGQLLRAVRAGCSDVIPGPGSATELSAAMERFQQSSALNRQAQASLGRVLAFFGAKGGVGTTTLAVHLAIHLVSRHGKKTLLIDHKHQLGHVALYLGLKDARYYFDELLKNVSRLDAELLNGFAIRHKSGLDVMASPEYAASRKEGSGDELERVMDFLRSEYDFVLIDSSMTYQDTKMSIIAEADEVYLVSTPDVAASRDLARMVEHIGLSPSANGKLHLLINRSTANDSLTAQQIQKAVCFPVAHSIPNNYAELLHAINGGEPLAPLQKSAFNQALSRITQRMVAGNEEATPPSVEAVETKGRRSFWH